MEFSIFCILIILVFSIGYYAARNYDIDLTCATCSLTAQGELAVSYAWMYVFFPWEESYEKN